MLPRRCLLRSLIPVASMAFAALASWEPVALAQINAYNPYADSQDHLPPVAPDGTLRWGTFYKSAALQQAYERLWNLGACRGTNKAITIPVESNKVQIDTLPEEQFRGVVVGTAGTLRGGMLAFSAAAVGAADPPTLVAALHPAGVSKLSVAGPMPVSALRAGMTVRVQTRVDRKGVAAEPVAGIDVITSPPGTKPDAVVADQMNTVVGTVTRVQPETLWLQVNAGRIRRLSLPLARDVVVNVDASQLELVAPGDVVVLEGRVWRGEGCLGDGLVFASSVTVSKSLPAGPAEPAERFGAVKPVGAGGF